MNILKKLFGLFLLFFTISILFSTQSEAQFTRSRRDGLWWTSIDGPNKYFYVVGYYFGASLGAEIVTENFPENSRCKKKAMDSFNSFGKELLNFNPEYLIFKTDSLYSDSTNLCLMGFHSLIIVSIQAMGYDSNFVKQKIDLFKKEDCDKFKSIEDLKKYKLPY
jgi:hypothetical protein